jgi:hypothetical protein
MHTFLVRGGVDASEIGAAGTPGDALRRVHD